MKQAGFFITLFAMERNLNPFYTPKNLKTKILHIFLLTGFRTILSEKYHTRGITRGEQCPGAESLAGAKSPNIVASFFFNNAFTRNRS